LREAQLVACTKIGVIVDVTVECGDEIRGSRGGLQLLAVHRVGVGLGNDADARPPRVAEHGHPRTLATDEQPQKVVGGDGTAHHARVVTEFADFGGRFVHEGPCIRRDTHGTGGEQRIVAAIGEERDDARVVVAHAVVPHRHVHTRRVASAHLETIECGERLLDGEVRRQCALVRAASGEGVHRLGGAQPVHAQCPHRIAQRGQPSGTPFHLGDGHRCGFAVEGGLDGAEEHVELVETGGEFGRQLGVPGEQPRARVTAQRGIDRGDGIAMRAVDSRLPAQRREHLVEACEQVPCVGYRARAGP